MNIAALQRCTLSDYPGKLAAIVFCRGCDFRCPYCHNPELLLPHRENAITPTQVLEFLQSRRGKLDAVVFSGGEPTLQTNELILLAAKIKSLGFHIKLDTNGSQPGIVAQLLKKELLDYIAMDIKGPPHKYPQIVGVPCDWRPMAESVALIKNSGIDYEFRTTVANPLLTPEDIESCAKSIQGAKQYILQPYKKLDPPTPESADLKTPTYLELDTTRQLASPWVEACHIRN